LIKLIKFICFVEFKSLIIANSTEKEVIDGNTQNREINNGFGVNDFTPE